MTILYVIAACFDYGSAKAGSIESSAPVGGSVVVLGVLLLPVSVATLVVPHAVQSRETTGQHFIL